MIEGRCALDFALELARMPTLAAAMHMQPLPSDTLVVIRIAAGCPDTIRAASELTGKSASRLREAAVLYLQQVLFAPGNDCYRILGVSSVSSRSIMREHLRWLMQWLHPDRDADDWESIFAERVIRAWRDANAAKSDPTDALQLDLVSLPGVVSSLKPRVRRRTIFRQRWIPVPIQRRRRAVRDPLKTLALAVIAGLVVSSLVAFAPASQRWLASKWISQSDNMKWLPY
jgi:hypothetical protein